MPHARQSQNIQLEFVEQWVLSDMYHLYNPCDDTVYFHCSGGNPASEGFRKV
jgi:hypothetical protein